MTDAELGKQLTDVILAMRLESYIDGITTGFDAATSMITKFMDEAHLYVGAEGYAVAEAIRAALANSRDHVILKGIEMASNGYQSPGGKAP